MQMILNILLVGFKYLDDLKERGAKIIIGDFYEEVARKVMFPFKRIDNVDKSMVTLAGDVSSIQIQNDTKARIRVVAAWLVQGQLVMKLSS